ncbi:MAG: hypothetical protein ACJ73D_08790 [Pyrinomonadaceae bacterium]
MKRNVLLTAVFALFAMAISASAQKTTDFSGNWTLDVSKSSPAETMIDSQTIKVTQTATDVKVERTTKVKPMPDAGAGAPAGGGGGRGFGGGQGGPQTYGIGTPVKVTRQTQNGDIEISMSAKVDGNKLTLSSATPQGSRDETWTLNADGSLTIQSQGRGGAVTRTYKKG